MNVSTRGELVRASGGDARSRRRRGHGDGGIRKRSDGRWEATLDLGFADGKRKRKFLYGATRREVAQKLDAAKQSVQQGLNLAGKRQTVGSWLDYWLEEIIRPEREATTYAGYETFCRLHIKPYLGSIPLDKLPPEELERWLRELDRRGVGVRTRQCWPEPVAYGTDACDAAGTRHSECG